MLIHPNVAVAVLLVVSSWQASGTLPHVYVNQALGFAVNYPATLRPIVRDAKSFDGGEIGWELVLDFVTTEPEPTTPLRIIVKRAKSPTYPPMDLSQLRGGCRNYSETKVGGKPAGVCVMCGRAACGWTVHVPGNPEFSIVSLDRDASSTSKPENGAHPIRSMIESMRFYPAGPR